MKPTKARQVNEYNQEKSNTNKGQFQNSPLYFLLFHWKVLNEEGCKDFVLWHLDLHCKSYGISKYS